MPAGGRHEREARRAADERARIGGGREVGLRAEQCAVDRQRFLVLHVDAGHARSARARPHRIAAQEGFADAARIGDEAAHVVEADRRVGDPVVEVLHQRPARDGRQRLERCIGGDAAPVPCVEARARAGVGKQRRNARAAFRAAGLGVAEALDPQLLQPRAAAHPFAAAAPPVERIGCDEGSGRKRVGHRCNLARRVCGALMRIIAGGVAATFERASWQGGAMLGGC